MSIPPPAVADPFEAERARLQALAYRMLGSMADAEDVVQDAWLRWHRLGSDGQAGVARPAAWLTTVASRLALDRLKSSQRQREEYVGPWLPEPILTDGDPALRSRTAVSDDHFDALVRNIYKVLLTRGMQGVGIHSVDPETNELLASLVRQSIKG